MLVDIIVIFFNLILIISILGTNRRVKEVLALVEALSKRLLAPESDQPKSSDPGT